MDFNNLGKEKNLAIILQSSKDLILKETCSLCILQILYALSKDMQLENHLIIDQIIKGENKS